MLLKSRVGEVFALVCVLQCVLSDVGQIGVYLNITRRNDGDVFTRFISNENNSSCERWFAVNMLPYSKENCTVQCKCKAMNKTYSIRLGKCASEDEMLNSFENCNGSFLPSIGKPLYDLSKPGEARLNVSFLTNQSYCNITSIVYFNGKNEVHLLNGKVGFNITWIQNGSVFLTWNPQSSSILPELQQFGYLLKVRLLCSDSEMTSQHQDSCFMIKTRGRIVKNIELKRKEHRLNTRNICAQRSTKSTNLMLLYILVGVGCACVLIVILVACYACYTRRRRLPRRSIPHNSSGKSIGIRKPVKTRGIAKNNGPTTPAIHDVIFNELSWDSDGGFSNRALSDPRVLEVDYGIPIDFGTLPRPESSTSIDSNRNSLSPLTDVGEHGQRRQ